MPYTSVLDDLRDNAPSSARLAQDSSSTLHSLDGVSPLADTSPKRVPNYSAYIQRLAFGLNSTTYYSGTCTAVACGIVLNYFDRTVSTSFVQTDMESEFLLSNVLGPDPKTQRADNLHRYLVDNCGMGAATWDMWVIQGIGNYRNSSAQRQSTGVSAETSAYNIWGWAKGEVDAGKPSMITTTLSGSANVSDWHSLAVYGYWEHSNGSMELLLHNGWPSDIYSSNGVYQVRELWANPSVASFVYRFNYSLNGWHQKFNNPAWYYYENNTVVTTTNIALTRYAGGDRYETAARASQGAFSSSSNVVLASSTSFPDALAGGAIAGKYNSPLVITVPNGASLATTTLAYIRAHRPSVMRILGGTNAIDELAEVRLSRIVP